MEEKQTVSEELALAVERYLGTMWPHLAERKIKRDRLDGEHEFPSGKVTLTFFLERRKE